MRWTASGDDTLWASRRAEFERTEVGMFGTEKRIYLTLSETTRTAMTDSGRGSGQREYIPLGAKTMTDQTMEQVSPAVLHTPGFAHSNVAWSPFHTTRIAVASSANYGIIGNGRLYVASTLPGPSGVRGIKLDQLSVC